MYWCLKTWIWWYNRYWFTIVFFIITLRRWRLFDAWVEWLGTFAWS